MFSDCDGSTEILTTAFTMPRQKPFHKSTAQTFQLLHRPQNDPLTNDPDAPSQVLYETSGPSVRNKHVKQRGDLEEEFGLGLKSGNIRSNEGEAAEHGVFYDDSGYDYMQHMRDIGTTGGEAVWLPAEAAIEGKGKQKQSLDDALRQAHISESDEDTRSTSDFSHITGMTSGTLKRSEYEKQQDIPDALRGFQPDMDPRLREVLEALEDEAYVEDEEEGFFVGVVGDGEELDLDGWEEQGYTQAVQDDDNGWDSDATEKPTNHPTMLKEPDAAISPPSNDAPPASQVPLGTDIPLQEAPPDVPESDDFMTNFSAYQREKDSLDASIHKARAPAPSDLLSAATGASRKKKRKGALTHGSAFSMTSSSIARTEALSTLDARFDKIEKEYMDDIPEDEEAEHETTSIMSSMTGLSHATGKTGRTARSTASKSAWDGSQVSEAPSLALAGSAFDGVMDDFIAKSGKGRKMKKGGRAGMTAGQSGMDQLDEIRAGLGPARFSSARKTGRV